MKKKRMKSLIGWCCPDWDLFWDIDKDFWMGEADIAVHPMIIRNHSRVPKEAIKVKITIQEA